MDENLSYLDVLNEEQRAAVEHEGSPLLILAGAGSGKTRVITTKIAYLISEKNIDPHQILAVTFTKKAANEMRERAVNLDRRAQYSQIRTFHSFGAWFLRLNAQSAGVDPNFTVYDDDDISTLVQKACPKLTKQQANHFAHEISLAKDYCYTPDSPNLANIDSDCEFAEVYAAYEKRLRETGNVDFGDLIMLPYLVLHNNEFVRERLNARFKVIMVDEYQDSNVAQFLLLQELSGVKYGLCANKENPDGTYVCVVGDDDQSIYKFRGAEIQNILTFKDKFPETRIIRLEKNYRSIEEILSIADDVVKNNNGRLGKTLFAERGKGKKPVLAFLPNQDEEAAFCADLISLAHKNGSSYSDWAILYRTNAQSLAFESTFLHRKIPYQVVGSLKFYEREEVKDLLAFLALIANSKDEIAFRRVINKPARGIGATSQEKIVSYARENQVNLLEACKALAPSLSKKAREGVQNFADLIGELEEKIGKIDFAVAALENSENFDGTKEIAFDEAENIESKSFGAGNSEARDSESDDSKSYDSKSEKFESELENAGTKISEIKKTLPGEVKSKLSELVEMISEKSGLKSYHESQDEISGTQKVANLQELANNAVNYECSMKGLIEFLDNIELDRSIEEASDGDEENQDRVTLITLHNTKGLEFNRVIITGMELGIFPRQDKSGDELEEERRLCYVGMTRARNELYLTSCAMRRMYGRTEYMAASPFLLEVNPSKLKAIGNIPSSYRNSAFHGGDYGARGLSHPDVETDPIKKKYSEGTQIYHDDYGYGVISRAEENADGEYCITVSFENSGKKKFLPKYQSKSLEVIKN